MMKGPLSSAWARGRANAGKLLQAAALMVGIAGGVVMPTGPALAQGVSDAQPFSGCPIDRITISITNPSADAAFNDRIEDSVRRALGVFPGATYSEDRLTFALGAARRNASIGDLSYDTQPTASGGVDVAVSVTLRDGAQPDQGRGFLITGNSSDFPLAFDRGGSYLKFKLDAFALYYGNNNAWYGRPNLMLAGNPLAQGTPAGRGYDDWVEGYLHYGVYGITPISQTLAGLIYAYVARCENSVQDSHLGFQIRTFWVAFALGVVCILTAATVVGLVVAVPCGLFAVVWTLLRLITGFVRATKDQPITGTRALGLLAQ